MKKILIVTFAILSKIILCLEFIVLIPLSIFGFLFIVVAPFYLNDYESNGNIVFILSFFLSALALTMLLNIMFMMLLSLLDQFTVEGKTNFHKNVKFIYLSIFIVVLNFSLVLLSKSHHLNFYSKDIFAVFGAGIIYVPSAIHVLFEYYFQRNNFFIED